ncbi:SRPBCC domain-containing protein [Sphingobacterium hungaricum]|uniref:ATPase n=1 Tax=Sphingobacterium hungaricum TaxID=2082723 RepID=A0A928YRI6_9SPHI|nr:SRPBCC domain-containing protein [Sphingobacterium hungaricum]MBE8714210.1 ATPase [Sphingobacterium hungaricum]
MKDYKKYSIITAPPEDIYLALTTEITARLWTGDEVEINATEGGEFSFWDGAIVGKFLELVPSSKIVQQWYFDEDSPASIVTIKLHPHKKGTSIEINQTNIPEEAYDDLVDGWENIYLASLVDFYEEED